MKGKKIAITFLQAGGVILFAGGFYVFTQNQIKPTTVYEFNRNMDTNVKVTASDLVKTQIPKDAVKGNFVTNPNQIVNKYVSSPVYKGQYVIKDNLINKGETDPFKDIDLSKMRLVTLTANYEKTLGGNIQHGDSIDLVYVGKGKKDNQDFIYAKTFMKNILVYNTTTADGYNYIDHTHNIKGQITDSSKTTSQGNSTTSSASSGTSTSANPNGSDTGKLATITIAVTPEQAEEISARQATGQIKVVGQFDEAKDIDTSGYIQGNYNKVFSGQGNAEANK